MGSKLQSDIDNRKAGKMKDAYAKFVNSLANAIDREIMSTRKKDTRKLSSKWEREELPHDEIEWFLHLNEYIYLWITKDPEKWAAFIYFYGIDGYDKNDFVYIDTYTMSYNARRGAEAFIRKMGRVIDG